ncbi:MAG: thiamine pyrophosphate-binding protein, partial [Holophaga sp.]
MSMVKVSDWILARLVQEGLKTVFFVPGGAAMHLNDSLAKVPQVSAIGTFHEHAAAVAAECYAKVTNRLGVAMVTAGPGSTNAITGVASAWVNSSPVLVLSGQVKRADLNPGGLRQSGLQEIDIVAMVKPITKYAVTITDPETTRFHLEKALHLARTGRFGPTWLCLPLDVQAMLIDPSSQPGYSPEASKPTTLSEDVGTLIQLLNGSERPVLLAGGGIRASGAEGQFLELVELLNIPVQTTWVAVDALASDHPLFAGRPGSFASRGANFTIQNSDFMLSLGARLDFATTGYSRERFARG